MPGTNISTHAYPVYDAVGNRKQYDRTFGTSPSEIINYGYNDIYELTSVTGVQTNSYDYDLVGNRELADGVSYTPNSLNQYTSVGGTAYLYDGNGNLTFNGTDTYAYDEFNRLLTFSDGTTNASYAYDAFNRRVSKTVNGTTTYFVYDGDSVIAEYDSISGLNVEYVHGAGDEILTMKRGDSTYYYFYDGLGSVSEITDSMGAVVENYTYDVYGTPSVNYSAIGNPYRFTGQEFDEESGLHHFNARTYNSIIGRFHQRDPIDYDDSMNLYQYVFNSPMNYTIKETMNKGLKADYKKSMDVLRGIFNSVDPEGLEPGQEYGTPVDEYDDEVAKIYSFIVHNLEGIKLNKNLLVDEISKIWMESFGTNCDSVNEIVNRISKELF